MTQTEAKRTGRALFSSAGAAFITRESDRRVLLVHHAASGKWVLAGGKAEWDEPPRATVEREAREELGVPVTVGRLLVVNWLTKSAELWPGAAENPYAYPCHMFTWLVTIAPENINKITHQPGELLDHRWCDLEEAVSTPGFMEPYNARNLRAAHAAHYADLHTVYLES